MHEAGHARDAAEAEHLWRLIVDGECEKRYFDYLMLLIERHTGLQPVDIRSVIGTAPGTYVRHLLRAGEPESEQIIYCVADVEGDTPHQIRLFEHRLAELQRASQMDPMIQFALAYSNCDFELWMILHKIDFYRTVMRKGQYLKPLRDAYGEIRSLAQYKRRRNFEHLLKQICLEDVLNAVRRADQIQRLRQLEGPPHKHCGYSYYPKNPSLSVGGLVRAILESAGLNF